MSAAQATVDSKAARMPAKFQPEAVEVEVEPVVGAIVDSMAVDGAMTSEHSIPL